MMDDAIDRYLWEGTGVPDPLCSHLERHLVIFSETADEVAPLALETRATRRWIWAAAAAAAISFAIGLGALAQTQDAEPRALTRALGVVPPELAPPPSLLECADEGCAIAVTRPANDDPIVVAPVRPKAQGKQERRARRAQRGAKVPTKASIRAVGGKGKSGNIDKAEIRRVVRGHIDEIRRCYNQGLTRNPNLAGRIAIQFTIASNGRVKAARVQSSDLADVGVDRCIVRAVKTWTFPKTKGENVVVTYPFVLRPG